jgi:N-acetylglucosamine-6-sulfatase
VNLTNSYYEQLVVPPLEWSIRSYGEAVRSMDRQIGRLLDALDELGLEDTTAVVYASDNGYLWGEHQLIDKRWPYEESIRIPFLVRFPEVVRRGGAESEQLVLNIDLAPTLLDLAGLEIPAHMQGRSILPLLRDPDSPWRDAFYYSYYREAPFPAPTARAIRTERHKYIEFDRKQAQLFDLERDPGEQNDLVGTEEGERLRESLASRLRTLESAARRGTAPPDGRTLLETGGLTSR